MTIDLLSVIRDDSAIKSGGFTGAVFLTYTLNLNFFEQIVAPALDQAGCSNVLILADPDGYQQALEIGAKSIGGVGLRYVCSPIMRKGFGIQHAKLLFMAGPNRGRLLIGSGNLTFPGYGRNLEIYSHFEYDALDVAADSSPFYEVWQLIHNIANDGGLSSSAQQQIKTIQENVTWLNIPRQSSESVVWHNYDHSLLEQLIEWRKNHSFVKPAKRVYAISPYYDEHMVALKKLASNLSPTQLQIHLDPALTNLDGKKAAKEWHGISPKLTVKAIGPGEEQNSHRHVHAKAILGQELNGSWCITGSANLSHAALLTSWENGGNLELVTFHWSEDPKAFDYLLKVGTIRTWSIDLLNITGTETEPSERVISQSTEVFLTDLSLQGEKLSGKLSDPLPMEIKGIKLHLQRRNLDVSISFNDETSFVAHVGDPLDEAECARIEGENFSTPYRWIDQPAVLARFGSRTYQVRIKGKLETLLGTEKLFQELMNFLWARVDIDDTPEDVESRLRRSSLRRKSQSDESEDENIPPGPEAFITEEQLIRSLHSRIDLHHPYDRSLLSLRDLLSLVLMRLTTTTQLTDIDASDDSEEQDQEKQAKKEEIQSNILERLRSYLISYCNRYANRLVDVEFVRNVPPEILFQNHFTLGRVLLEFSNKASQVFTNEDLAKCFWLIWAPLAWPEIVGSKGLPTLRTLIKQFEFERIQEAWKKMGMPNLAKIMASETLRQPPNWETGLRYSDQAETFLVANEWIKRTKQILGVNAFSSHVEDSVEAYGVPNVSSLSSPSPISEFYLSHVLANFTKIENYRPPIEEKYSLFFELENSLRNNPLDKNATQILISEITKQGLGVECQNFLANQKPISGIILDEEGELYCPRCGAELTENSQGELIRGRIVLCQNSKDTWLYLKPQISIPLF